MIQVNYGNNMKKETAIVDENTTIRSFLEDVGIDYSRGQTSIDGAPLNPGDMDKTFAQLGVTTRCFLFNVVKLDNA